MLMRPRSVNSTFEKPRDHRGGSGSSLGGAMVAMGALSTTHGGKGYATLNDRTNTRLMQDNGVLHGVYAR